MNNQNIWVVFEISDNTPKKVSLELMQKAKKEALSNQVRTVAVIINEKAQELASVAFLNGADDVITVEQTSAFEASGYILEKLSKKYEPGIILFGATNWGRDVAANLSARIKCGIACESTDIILDAKANIINWIRPSYTGKLNTNIEISGFPQIGTFKTGSFPILEASDYPETGNIIAESVEVPTSVILTELLGFIPDDELTKSNIEDAEIIIAGGRGVGSAEGFRPLFELAELVGGKVGASRAAVDEGWIEYERQIGVSGKTVAPKLYIGFGISGAVPHIAGIKNSQVIVAVNKDKYAPIFEISNYGIVEDLNEVLPVLIEKVRSALK